MEDQKLNTLHNKFSTLFKTQVESDNQQFGIHSIYLPNPLFTATPKYCLVAMEPSLGGMKPEVFQNWVNQGFMNFLLSEGDFILHYCTYTFLCNNSFSYQISDISKGAMNTDLANRQRKERYSNWLEILKEELELFDNPKLISVGSKAKEFLHKEGFQSQACVIHYSQNNCGRFGKYYEQHSQKFLTENIHIELKEFTEKILDAANYDDEMKNSILNKVFNKELSDWKKGMILHYIDKFSIENN